ncbi:rhodanese-like domain-containing protein [Paenibacillus sp. J31TS4]|uniref:rhodanese-like domain-containing protein n=1 Tax=Paenibacillus sp. J31TS4 TaxID=2807195 RepID=UPI001B01660B|nr:rhodanese-like domain-containing protein [Paenibacillus sp. J31TS4]GIP40832.1 rhodanese-like domain-containing protein [Paenibacillus sp. J31TS4]
MALSNQKEISPDELAERLASGEALFIVDVREPQEWAAGHLSGSLHIPLGQLPQRAGELDREREIILVCRSGNRSGLACELLGEQGFRTVNMTGGLLAWTGELV